MAYLKIKISNIIALKILNKKVTHADVMRIKKAFNVCGYEQTIEMIIEAGIKYLIDIIDMMEQIEDERSENCE